MKARFLLKNGTLLALLLVMGCQMAYTFAQEASSARFPIIANQPASRTTTSGTTVIFTVGVSGGGPFTYQWQHDGTNLPNGIITTVVGKGTHNRSDSGDGGSATSAGLASATGVAVDAFENIFIGDVNAVGHSVRKVDTNGLISTLRGAAGDHGKMIALAADAAGNVFVCGSRQGGPELVRKVARVGNVSIVAGSDKLESYFSMRDHRSEPVAYGGDGGPAVNALLNGPSGLAVDGAGNLFIADEFNNRVRKVDSKGIITTVAGDGTEGYSRDGGTAIHAHVHSPGAVAVDAAGHLFIAETGNNLIRKVSPDGLISTVAGGGTERVRDGLRATNVDLYILSEGLVVDGSGNLFFTTFHEIRKVDTNGIITTVAGEGRQGCAGDGGPGRIASLWVPYGLALDRWGNLFIADTGCGIRKVENTQGPGLVLHNVGASDSGDYRVVMTGAGDSVTSSVATLTIGANGASRN